MNTFNDEDIKKREEKQEIEIDLRQLFTVILGKLWLILLTGFAVAVVAFLVTKLFMTPIYESSTKIYVLNKTSEATNVTSADLQAGTQLTKDYQQLILSRTVLEKVIREKNLDMTADQMKGKIVVSAPVDTRVLEIIVSDSDPKVAQEIANSVREVASDHIQKVMNTQAVNTVDEASLAKNPSRPSTMKNTLIGGMLGVLLAMAIVIIIFMLDDRIRTVEDVERQLGLGVLGMIPLSEPEVRKKAMANKKGQVIQKKRR